MHCRGSTTPTEERGEADNILPDHFIFGLLRRGMEQIIEHDQEGTTIPAGCPSGKLFVPPSLRSKVEHTSKIACHPRINRTLQFILQKFWWLELKREIIDFDKACSVCVCGKATHQPPAGLLHPLLVPPRLWSHISLDFIIALPSSRGKSMILTMVDHFFQNLPTSLCCPSSHLH